MIYGSRIFFSRFYLCFFFIILAFTRKEDYETSGNPEPHENSSCKKSVSENYERKSSSSKAKPPKHFKNYDFPFDKETEPDEFRRNYTNYYANVADDAMMGDKDAIEELRDEFGDDWKGEW